MRFCLRSTLSSRVKYNTPRCSLRIIIVFVLHIQPGVTQSCFSRGRSTQVGPFLGLTPLLALPKDATQMSGSSPATWPHRGQSPRKRKAVHQPKLAHSPPGTKRAPFMGQNPFLFSAALFIPSAPCSQPRGVLTDRQCSELHGHTGYLGQASTPASEQQQGCT